MSEQTIPLREQVAQAIYTEWDRQLFERGSIPCRLPWELAEEVAQERYLLSADAALAAIAAQPRPEMAEIEAAVERFRLCAYELGKADRDGNYILQDRWGDRIDDAKEHLDTLIQRALAVMPAPTDAEFEAAMTAFEDAVFDFRKVDARKVGENIFMAANRQSEEFQSARRTLRALHVRAKQQGLMELRVAVDRELKFWKGVGERESEVSILTVVLAQIDAMLGDS